jgi:hypothetical protein
VQPLAVDDADSGITRPRSVDEPRDADERLGDSLVVDVETAARFVTPRFSFRSSRRSSAA